MIAIIKILFRMFIFLLHVILMPIRTYRILRAHSYLAEIDELMTLAISEWNLEAVDELIKTLEDKDFGLESGNTLLKGARIRNLKMVKELILTEKEG